MALKARKAELFAKVIDGGVPPAPASPPTTSAGSSTELRGARHS